MSLPKLTATLGLTSIYCQFLTELSAQSFSSEIHSDYPTRLIHATDNSIYQVVPEAVIHIKNELDVVTLFRLASKPEYHTIQFAPRGGGTGTNGQSLTAGIILDFSKTMKKIGEFKGDCIVVEPGVVIDDLNSYLRTFNKILPLFISTSNRATVGGMVNTDAHGRGSFVYGKTNRYVVALRVVLMNGEVLIIDKNTDHATLTEPLRHIVTQFQAEIKALPKEVHALTGYNLIHLYNEETNKIDLTKLFCGAEGTLGVVTEITFSVAEIPQAKKLIAIKYDSFIEALRDGVKLLALKPSACEVIDEVVLKLAQQDVIYNDVKSIIENEEGALPQALTLVEIDADSLAAYQAQLTGESWCVVDDPQQINALWTLRKKGVGLLANLEGDKQPCSGIEDTMVEPRVLADFISELKVLLDGFHLTYGMYGHIDSGCIHVRPAFDMKNSEDEKLYRKVCDSVAALVKKYRGIMWGEHGKGFRSEYVPLFFGPVLYQQLSEIKKLFDPANQLNPGKLITTDQFNVDGPKRSAWDKEIKANLQQQFKKTIQCNGNALCFNTTVKNVMCPSYKVTGNRLQSPKGRAVLMREWLRQVSIKDVNLEKLKTKWFKKTPESDDFSTAVYDAMSGCLGCKACSSECPVHVNVPKFKAKFLSYYYTRYYRSMSEWLIKNSERFALWQLKLPSWLRKMVNVFYSEKIFNRLGLVDIPKLENNITVNYQSSTNPSVLLVQDWLTSCYDNSLLQQYLKLFELLEVDIQCLPLFETGMPYYAMGDLKKFEKISQSNIDQLNQLASHQLIGIEPSVTLFFREEYQGNKPMQFHVQLLEEWLINNVSLLQQKVKPNNEKYYLFLHCSEKTAIYNSQKLWETLFAACNLDVTIVNAGCCGMAGHYGHEKKHLENSLKLFNMGWNKFITENKLSPEQILATGFSCRAQLERFQIKARHPVDVFLQ